MAQGLKQQYKETLDYMFSKLPMFQRVGAIAYKKNLDNIKALCNALDNPQNKFPSIHIAGTNGKGSTSHMLAAAFQSKSLKTGLYVSPHYKDYRERIKINGSYITKKFVIDFIDKLKPLIEEINPSFFEINVAMAFSYFAFKNVDIAIIETGLGGRLDSTNIINPELCVISNISYDHMNLLGNTLPEIAFEKAGIIKKGIPVVIGEYQEETIEVFKKKAKEQNAKLLIATEHIKINQIESTPSYDSFDIYWNNELWLRKLKLDLKGSFQQKNLTTVLSALRVYNNINPDFFKDEVIRNAMSDVIRLTRFMGRWQILEQEPLTICDSGHNEAGIDFVVSQLSKLNYKKLHMVIGVVNDKAVDKMLNKMPTKAIYYFAKADVPRGLDANELKVIAKSFDLYGRAYNTVKNAYRSAKRNANKDDLIFIGGSTFVVAEVL